MPSNSNVGRFKKLDERTWKGNISNELSFYIVSENDNRKLPANGGLRFMHYNSEQAAQKDGLHLSKAMAEKHNIYNTGFKGAKIVANGKVSAEHKNLLLAAVGSLLNQLKGTVYTGCDLNTTMSDMYTLGAFTPYILAGLNSTVDPSFATAYGIFGSIKGTVDKNLQHCSFLVHGTGKTGRIVAELLSKTGFKVYTHDALPENAKVKGCEVLAMGADWYLQPVDCVVLCSASHVISEEIAHKIQCKYLVSGANNPFTTKNVGEILSSRGIKWVPDTISNAGAVICDSIEFYNNHAFLSARPQEIYDFVEKTVYYKTFAFNELRRSKLRHIKVPEILKTISANADQPCGVFFRNNEEHIPSIASRSSFMISSRSPSFKKHSVVLNNGF